MALGRGQSRQRPLTQQFCLAVLLVEVQLQQQQWLEWEAQQQQWWVVVEVLEQQQAPWLMGQEQQQPPWLGVEGDQEQHRLIFVVV